MNEALRTLVRERAGGLCEYCRMPQTAYRGRFQVEHVIAVQHAGPTRPDNLAHACQNRNRHKGPNLTGIDPDTGRLTRPYHPRTDLWSDHFARSGHLVVGRTDIGRTTVAVLAMNADDPRSVRAALMLTGDFPPPG